MIFLSDIQRIQTVQRYLSRQKRFIKTHVKSLCRYYTIDFNIRGYILRSSVLDDYFVVEVHSDEFLGLHYKLQKYPCQCTKEILLDNLYFWLETMYLGIDTSLTETIKKYKLKAKYDSSTLEIAKRHETLSYRAEELVVFKG